MNGFEKKDFDFEKNLKQLVRRLNSVTSSIDGNYTEHEAARNGNSLTIEAGNVVSCQIVNFNSESSSNNEYLVYNYCQEVNKYEEKLAVYFANDANKSILSIFRKWNDDGVWYSERKNITAVTIISLTDSDYHKPNSTTATYENYENEEECKKQWENWSSLMFDIYPDKVNSVFAKNIDIPISKSDDSKKLYSGIYVTFTCPLSPTQIGIMGRICETFLYEIARTDLIPTLYENVEKQSTRAAITQVNARNTSHNIGAHVMNKLIGDLRKLVSLLLNKKVTYQSSEIKELHKDIKENLKKNEWYNKADDAFKILALENEIALSQISIFNNYVKCRMDYLADIALGTPLMQTNKWAYNELFQDLDKVRLLLEYIAGLSDFKYKIEFKKNGEPLTDTNDLLVAIPNDILGTQAFYNILENIIRNTAKHSSNKPTLTIFTVNFIDEYDKKRNCGNETEIKNILNEFIAVEVYDNIPVEGDGRDLTEDEKEEYKKRTHKELARFEARIDELVFTQNRNLNDDILQDNKLRPYALGLVEMDASAAYLRKRDVSFINHRSYEIQYDESWSRDTELNSGKQEIRGTNCRHFLKVFKTVQRVSAEFEKEENGKTVQCTNSGHALGYRFFLHRPAIALVVTDKPVENKDKLKKKGIWIVPSTKPKDKSEKDESFETHLKAGKVYNHEFVIIDNEVKYDKVGETEFVEHYKTSLPIRILNTIENLSELLTEPADEIERRCWEKWATRDNVTIFGRYNPSETKPQAVFLDHLYSDNKEVKCICGKGDLCSNTEWCNNKDASYVEALSSLGQSKLPDFSRLTKDANNVNDKLQKYIDNITKPNTTILCKQGVYIPEEYIANKKIEEAVQTKVIVIDERIQEAAEKSDFMKVPYKELYAKMNVLVPDKKELNLSESSFAKAKKGVENYIKEQVIPLSERDFILIHYSILERMYPKKEINENLEYLIGESKINVVVTSGRGIPDNLSEKVRFVNLSSIITAFVDIRCKYSINYLLNSTRKSSKI